MTDVIINIISAFLLSILVFLSWRNSNLFSLLLLLLIPKLIDVLFISPVALEAFDSDGKEHWFYFVHSLNDIFLFFLIYFRFWIFTLFGSRFVYKRMKSEYVLMSILALSVSVNFLVFNEYVDIVGNGLTERFFYDSYKEIKYVFMAVETAILCWLTFLTMNAWQSLKQKGLVQ